ncbi:uncharacterized protein BJ171DRAFT_582592 [Polychytrium aggregatum]|uniref:uncharacterized protein n=1 Tax=Polychytrium aggregatum TaxID=110093 RepID=UPI0022FEB2A1|nr:uncharacterized protein BJ171DRAFT_582592 [Polychytrium aggregatum]KAI9203827.1 hypothetical protein BJ171DRAFT_582592 [Polychytrium aggregatum]
MLTLQEVLNDSVADNGVDDETDIPIEHTTLPYNVRTWTGLHVATWLHLNGFSLHSSNLNNSLTGNHLLKMTSEDLKIILRIADWEQRMKLWRAIEKLQLRQQMLSSNEYSRPATKSVVREDQLQYPCKVHLSSQEKSVMEVRRRPVAAQDRWRKLSDLDLKSDISYPRRESGYSSTAASESEEILTESKEKHLECLKIFEESLQAKVLLGSWGYSNCSLIQLSDSEMALAMELLEHNSSLQSLTLCYNGINDEGAKLIAQALSKNTTLKELDLSSNCIGPVGAQAIANTLVHHNTTLTSLRLNCNSLGDAGAIEIGFAIRGSTSLTDVDLTQNDITDKGAVFLAECLTASTRIKSLNLIGNSIEAAGTKRLLAAFERHTTLHAIHMNGSGGWGQRTSPVTKVKIDPKNRNQQPPSPEPLTPTAAKPRLKRSVSQTLFSFLSRGTTK